MTKKRTGKQTVVETPVVLTSYNFVAAPNEETENFYLDVILDKTDAAHAGFIADLEKIHEANIEHERSAGLKEGIEVMPLNLKALGDTEPLNLLEKIDANNLDRYVKLRMKSKFDPKIVSTKGRELKLKKNLPAGVSIRVRGKAASYLNNGRVGTTFYVNLIQLSPMENEEFTAAESGEASGFTVPWPGSATEAKTEA